MDLLTRLEETDVSEEATQEEIDVAKADASREMGW